jgi:hypothetical protein
LYEINWQSLRLFDGNNRLKPDAFLSLPHGGAPYHGVEPQPHESPLAGGNAVAAEKPSTPLEEKNALTIFYVCALDLLAQTEAQHRAVVEAQTRLEACMAEWRMNPPAPAERKNSLSTIAQLVSDVVAAVRAQRLLASDMQRAVSALQMPGEKS